MTHFESYIELTKEKASSQAVNAIEKTVSDIIPTYIKPFDFNSHKSGLLLGNVQSGKTSHMLGVLAAAADNDFKIFIVLTTDNTHLQKQTFQRAFKFLDDTFCVCHEQDDMRFLANEMKNPVAIILKKIPTFLKHGKRI